MALNRTVNLASNCPTSPSPTHSLGLGDDPPANSLNQNGTRHAREGEVAEQLVVIETNNLRIKFVEHDFRLVLCRPYFQMRYLGVLVVQTS